MRLLLAGLGVLQLAVGGWMMFATQSFGERIASFDGFNEHDLRDFATFYLARGLHAINHAVDVSNSDPAWVGPAELAALGGATAVFGWLSWITARSIRS